MTSDAERRYEAAKAYVDRAVATVLALGMYSPMDALGAREKTAPVVSDTKKLDAKWLRATTETVREALAKEAENLADRTKENLPGAPPDWKRTNLYKGETEKQAAPTTYAGAVAEEASLRAHQVGQGLGFLASGLGGVAKLGLLGGAVFLGLKLVSAFESRRERAR